MTRNLEGIAVALVATALYTLTAALGKHAAVDYHVLQILFVRQVIVLLSVVPTIAKDFPENLKTRHPVQHGFRMIGAFLALAGGLWAVTLMPLTTAVVLMFSQTFLVSLLAMWFLGERLGWHRGLSIVACFVGVIVVMRPGADSFGGWEMLVPLVASMGAAVAVVCVRRLSQTEKTATLLVWQAGFVGLMSGLPMFWLWVQPSLADFLLLVGIGVIATLAQWLGIRALRLGEASIISSIKYTELVFAGILGWLMFADVLDVPTLTGAAIIIAAALYMIRREAVSKKVAEIESAELPATNVSRAS